MKSLSSNKTIFIAAALVVVLILVGGFVAYKKLKTGGMLSQNYNASAQPSPASTLGSQNNTPLATPNAQNSNNASLDSESSQIDSSLNSLNSDLNSADQQLNSQSNDTNPAPVQ